MNFAKINDKNVVYMGLLLPGSKIFTAESRYSKENVKRRGLPKINLIGLSFRKVL